MVQNVVLEVINSKDFGEPIFTKEIILELNKRNIFFEKNNLNVIIHRLIKKGIISSHSKGIYYKPKITILGIQELDPSLIIKRKYIQDSNNDIFGLKVGYKIFTEVRLDVVEEIKDEIYSNECTSRSRTDKSFNIQIKKPKVPITKDNLIFHKTLYLLKNKDKLTESDKPKLKKAILTRYFTILGDTFFFNLVDFVKGLGVKDKKMFIDLIEELNDVDYFFEYVLYALKD